MKASEILAHVIDERSVWRRLLTSDDDRVVLSAMTFLVSMRDGRPTQQVNLTSLSVSVSADDIASARAIVAELRDQSPAQSMPSEPTRAARLMLLDGEGGETVGEGE
jgi:hypothetical protein